MKTEAITPLDAGQAPSADAMADVQQLIQQGLGLPARWSGTRRFVVLDTGFGRGECFLACWAAWQADPQRCAELVCIALAEHPPRREDLVRTHEGTPVAALAHELAAAWPPLTPNIHALDFEGGRVRLLLALGNARRLLPQISARVDAFYLRPTAWDARLVAGLARLARPGAALVAGMKGADLHHGLVSAGFLVHQPLGGSLAQAATLAHYAPRFTPRRAPGREPAEPGRERHALIIGAGIAGACAASSLARLGWRCTVLERHATPAQEASGNPAGLFHGTAHAADGVHARLHRAAALFAAQRYAPLLRSGRVPGGCDGLRRVNAGALWPGLPADYVALMSDGTTALYPSGGWIAPGPLVQTLLSHPGITLLGSASVASLRRDAARWVALTADGESLADAPVMVLAGAQGTEALLQRPDGPVWPTSASRGQITWFLSPQRLGLPVTGAGYALQLPSSQLLCGATAQEDELDSSVSQADHDFNLQRLRTLTGIEPAMGTPLHGRVGWRWQTADRLPLVGAVPAAARDVAAGTRLDHARLVPRVPGLFVLGGLGSRGLTWGPLAGEILASWIDDAPQPIEADLLDAIDPARWVARTARSG